MKPHPFVFKDNINYQRYFIRDLSKKRLSMHNTTVIPEALVIPYLEISTHM